MRPSRENLQDDSHNYHLYASHPLSSKVSKFNSEPSPARKSLQRLARIRCEIQRVKTISKRSSSSSAYMSIHQTCISAQNDQAPGAFNNHLYTWIYSGLQPIIGQPNMYHSSYSNPRLTNDSHPVIPTLYLSNFLVFNLRSNRNEMVLITATGCVTNQFYHRQTESEQGRTQTADPAPGFMP